MTRVRVGALAALVVSFAIAAGARAAPDDPPPIKPVSDVPWSPDSPFKFEGKERKKRQALSGIACPVNSSGQRLCLAVFDEGGEARYLVIRDNGYSTDTERVVLIADDAELDAEGAATDGRFYYVTGSHSAKRGDCESNPASRHVIRFKVDGATGRALRDPAGNPTGKLVERREGDLWRLMQKVSGLKEHVGENMCLGTERPEKAPHLTGRRGVNVEGLAIKGGRLFFGFRGPAADGVAKILAIDADAFFDGADARPELASVKVGRGRAIRDLHAVSDGILVLAGPDDDDVNEKVGWIVAHLPIEGTDSIKAADFKPLALLDLEKVALRDCDKELKPEAMAVVEDKPGQPYRLIIFSDGMCDGGPLKFEIRR
jgi:hypothetical protein